MLRGVRSRAIDPPRTALTRARIPDDVLTAAHERSRARAERDWAEADRLRAIIEDAGWKVVDRGVDFRLSPAVQPDVQGDGATIHGSSASVPSRLEEPVDRAATVVLVVDDTTDLGGVVARLSIGRGAAQLIAIAGPNPVADPPDGVEVVRMVATATLATRLNAGIRRATGAVVVLLDGTAEISGDVVDPLVRALDDPAVAIAGGWGTTTEDLRTFTAALGDVDVVDLGCAAARRADLGRIGPLDERFSDPRWLGAWLSLALRFGSMTPVIDAEAEHRAARAVAVPAERRTDRAGPGVPSSGTLDEAGRKAARRDFYRLRDAFGSIISDNRADRA